jgi:hypothetical protein
MTCRHGSVIGYIDERVDFIIIESSEKLNRL